MQKNDGNRKSGQPRSRRDFFKTAGQTVVASALSVGTIPYVDETVYSAPDDAPVKRSDSAMIGPKDNIRVTKIDTFVLKNSWVFVKISTDAGITGWGEMLKDDAKACATGALEVGNYLIGKDPLRVTHHWQAIHRGSFYRGGPIKTAILSGIDQGLMGYYRQSIWSSCVQAVRWPHKGQDKSVRESRSQNRCERD